MGDRPPVGGDAALWGRPGGGRLPFAVLVQQDAAPVQADDVNHRLRRLLEKGRRVGRTLQDLHRRLQPFDYLFHLGVGVDRLADDIADRLSREPRRARQRAGRNGRLGQAAQRRPAGALFERLDADVFLAQGDDGRDGQLTGLARLQFAAVGQADADLGAGIGQLDAIAGDRLDEGVIARDGILVQPGDDQPGPLPVATGRVEDLATVALPAQFDRAGEGILVDFLLLVVDQQLQGTGHMPPPSRGRTKS